MRTAHSTETTGSVGAGHRLGRRTASAALTALICIYPATVGAAASSAAVGGDDDLLGAGRLIDVSLGLGAVLLFIVIAAWLARRMLRIAPGGNAHLKIVGGMSMGPRERLVLVQVGTEQLLIGVSPGRLQTLHVLADPIVTATAAAAPVPGSFAQALHARFSAAGTGGAPPPRRADD